MRDLTETDELSINPKSRNYYFLPQATTSDAYFIDNIFGYYGLPKKYLNRTYKKLRDDPTTHEW